MLRRVYERALILASAFAFGFSGSSLASNVDMATTVAFNAADDTLDYVRTVHFTKLLDAVNAVRAAAALLPVSFTAPAPDATPKPAVTRDHLMTLRGGLDAARTQLSLPAISYIDATITAFQTPIKDEHIIDLRNGVQ